MRLASEQDNVCDSGNNRTLLCASTQQSHITLSQYNAVQVTLVLHRRGGGASESSTFMCSQCHLLSHSSNTGGAVHYLSKRGFIPQRSMSGPEGP